MMYEQWGKASNLEVILEENVENALNLVNCQQEIITFFKVPFSKIKKIPLW